MRSAIISALGLALLGAGCGASSDRRPASAPEEPEAVAGEPDFERVVAELAAPLVEDGWLVGVSIGWIANGERGVVGLGATDLEGGQVPDGDTLFEIGSITKAFTGIALAAMAEEGELAFDTPIAKLFPELEIEPHDEGPITLEHLATHHAGLPRLPDNFTPAAVDHPYADYGRAELMAFLEAYEPTRAPGALYEYSNLGAGLLGEALAIRAETTYAKLVEEQVLKPLGLKDTAVYLSSDQADRLATGHVEGEAVPPWTFQALAGAGALRSTVSDLLSLIEAHFSADGQPLAGALTEARRARARIPGGDWVGLGWHIGLEARGGPAAVVWHNGGTGGFHSFLAFDPQREIGVVVLANSMQPTIETLGVALLRMLRGEQGAFELPRLVEVERDVLRKYEGVYEITPSVRLILVREGGKLLAQVTGQPQFPIYPSSETEFFYQVVDARIVFRLDDEGEVEGLTLVQGGETYEATLTDEPLPRRLEIVEVEIPAAVLDRYVGVYRVGAEVKLEVTRTEEGLVAQVTGQPAFAIVPTSQTDFVYRDVDAEISFVVGEGGEVTKLLLRQAGQQVEARKIE
jgi:serine-type D-Ala-D-Ala carboxypeptidase/endopeptidase